jgi:hypothetical protein
MADIIFEDHRNWISKAQRTKIRDYCDKNACPTMREILAMIEYRPGEGKYFNCTMTDDPTSLNSILTFCDKDPDAERRKELRERLSQRIRNSRGSRSKQTLDSYKRYYQLMKQTTATGTIPTPPDVIKNRSQYESILTTPDLPKNVEWFRDYITLCFADESSL